MTRITDDADDDGTKGSDPRVSIAAEWWSAKLEITEKRPAFRDALAAILANVLPQHAAARTMTLRVDYDPRRELLEAARVADIECRGVESARGVFPIKTSMRISRDTITVNVGRGGADEVIWRADTEHEKPEQWLPSITEVKEVTP